MSNGSHFGFLATSREQVGAFYAKALALGGQGDGARGQRAHYGPQYYGAFMRDLDGHEIAPCSGMRRWGDFSQSC